MRGQSMSSCVKQPGQKANNYNVDKREEMAKKAMCMNRPKLGRRKYEAFRPVRQMRKANCI